MYDNSRKGQLWKRVIRISKSSGLLMKKRAIKTISKSNALPIVIWSALSIFVLSAVTYSVVNGGVFTTMSEAIGGRNIGHKGGRPKCEMAAWYGAGCKLNETRCLLDGYYSTYYKCVPLVVNFTSVSSKNTRCEFTQWDQRECPRGQVCDNKKCITKNNNNNNRY